MMSFSPSSIGDIIISLFSYQFISLLLSNISQISDFPRIRENRGQSTTHYWAVPCNLSHSPPGPSRLSDQQLSYPRQLAGWPRQAGRQETHSHNDVMDLDTLLWIKCWANGCIVRYDILVTGHERAVSQQGPRTTQLSFNRELTSNQYQVSSNQSSNRVLTSATAMLADIRYSSPLLSSPLLSAPLLCNCILFIWCRSQPSTEWCCYTGACYSVTIVYSGSIILEMKIWRSILYSMHHWEDKNPGEILLLSSVTTDHWSLV